MSAGQSFEHRTAIAVEIAYTLRSYGWAWRSALAAGCSLVEYISDPPLRVGRNVSHSERMAEIDGCGCALRWRVMREVWGWRAKLPAARFLWDKVRWPEVDRAVRNASLWSGSWEHCFPASVGDW